MPEERMILLSKPRLWSGTFDCFVSVLSTGVFPLRRLPLSARVILFFGKAPIVR